MWQIIAGVLGCIIYLYLMWRVLKVNYKEEDAIAFGWVSLLAYLIGSRVVYSPVRWFEFWKMGESNVLGGLVAWIFLAWLISSDRGWRFFAFADDNLELLLWLNGVFFLVSQKWWLLVLTVVAALVSWPLKKKYRSFIWYKSGKKGFTFLAVLVLFSIGLCLIYRSFYFIIPALICGVGLGILGSERNT